MKRGSFLFLTFILSIGFGACTTLKESFIYGSSSLTLEKAEKIIPGKTSKDEIIKQLGNPKQENDLSEMPYLDDDGVLWSYVDGGKNRLSLYFKKNSAIVSSVGWQIRNGEREQSLETAKKLLTARFGSMSFQYRDKAWSEDDKGFEAAYEDLKAGVVVLVNKDTNQVTSITWSDPLVLSERAHKWSSGRISCHHGNDCVWIDAAGKQTRTITSPDNTDLKR